ncbi:MAG: DUF2252 family protein [Candidatus Dormibacteraeota bacterium]|nr:DUF2252 family protein [Candidatus Dormibacteraeota bacterium]
MRAHVTVVEADLEFKHEQMATAAFPFLRATFYRWMQLWPLECPDLASAPHVLAVGDLHIENFGTWRDDEGRLVWGVNDFDEAYPLPYTIDLVRLATSVRLAIGIGRLRLSPRRACAAILAGYRGTLQRGGRPFVLAEEHEVLRREATSELRSPVAFWQRMDALPAVANPSPEAAELLRSRLSKDVTGVVFVSRRAGLGSLGHPRIVAKGVHHGGQIAREAKALLPSACAWASPPSGSVAIHYQTIVRRAVRNPDPFLSVSGDWVMRRLAPDCSRIDFIAAHTKAEQEELMHAMGSETAHVHLGADPSRIRDVEHDLETRPEDWLRSASRAMAKATGRDFDSWRHREQD